MFNASGSRFKRPGTELVEVQCFAFKVQGSMLRVQGSKGRALSLSKCNASRSYFDRLSIRASRSIVQMFYCSFIQLFNAARSRFNAARSIVQMFYCSFIQLFTSLIPIVKILASPNLHILTSPHPYILKSSHPHIFTSPHPHISKLSTQQTY